MADSPERSYTRVRGLPPFCVDEPCPAGGTNTAPRPTEYLVGGLAGSIAALAPAVAAVQGVRYTGLAVEAEAWLDLRGVRGEAGADPAFRELALEVRLATDATAESVAALGSEIEQRSPILVMLRRAGVAVRTTWRIDRGVALPPAGGGGGHPVRR